MNTSIIADTKLTYGKFQGKRFSWVMDRAPTYVAWAKTQVPTCGTELFLMVQYAEHRQAVELTNQAFQRWERKWQMLRTAHNEWMQHRKSQPTSTTPGSENGCKQKTRGESSVYSFLD